MRKFWIGVCVVLGVFLATASIAFAAGSSKASGGAGDGDILVKYADDVMVPKSASIEAIGYNTYVVQLDGANMEEKLRELRADKDVVYAQPNYEYKMLGNVDDPKVGDQWHIGKMNIPKAWDVTMGKASIKVAVIDSGVDVSHPDLVDRVAGTYDVVNGNKSIDYPVNHGTHVAGIIAATANNGSHGAGVAPKVSLLCYDVFGGSGTAKTSSIIKAINRAIDEGARVINMSLGGYYNDKLLEDAVNRAKKKKISIICAAGNGINGVPQTNRSYPADYDAAISVVPVDSADKRPSWADYNKYKDIAAPGVKIYSTLPGSFGSMTGSSMASPYVAGVYALMYSANPKLTCDAADKILFDTAKDLGKEGKDNYYGYGLVQPMAAVYKAAGREVPIIAPEGLKASCSSITKAKLTWKKVNGATGYEIYRATSKDGKYTKVKTISKNSTVSYTDTKLTTGKTYYYKIRAYKTKDGKKKYGDYSSIKSIKIVLLKPSGFSASIASMSSAKLAWKKVGDAAGYEIYRATSKDGKYTKIKTISKNSTVSYTDSKLSTGKTYYYKVRAYRMSKEKKLYSGYTDVESAKIAPGTPSEPKATSAGNKSVKVAWKKAAKATGYEVYRATSKDGEYKKVKTIAKSDTLSYTDSKLTTGKTYYYKVRSYATVEGGKKYSGYSKVVSAKAAPAPPANFKATKVDNLIVLASWNKVAGASGYEIYMAYQNTKRFDLVGSTNDKRSKYNATIVLIMPGTYYCKARSYTEVKGKKVYGSYTKTYTIKI